MTTIWRNTRLRAGRCGCGDPNAFKYIKDDSAGVGAQIIEYLCADCVNDLRTREYKAEREHAWREAGKVEELYTLGYTFQMALRFVKENRFEEARQRAIAVDKFKGA